MVGPWRLILLRKNSFSLTFSVSIYNRKLCFSFFISVGLREGFLPNNKKIYKRSAVSHGALLGWYPFVAGVCYVLFSLLCRLCCCLYPNLVDSGEKARGIVPPPILSALAARGTVGIELKFLGQLGTYGSFLPPPTSSQKSHLARWQRIATSCLPGQQEMA